jgi:diaminohydroxyphosphoribosylaminopyrimidine deaminase/5-amino-6-(5-phosphoribosylamino)uracil reductase
VTVTPQISQMQVNAILDVALEPLVNASPERPFVVAQLGQSLDGRIATPTGASKYINGPCALDFLHGLRASVDAVAVGIGTVLADDPLLTVRRVCGKSPARVIIDPNSKLPDKASCLNDDGAAVYVVRKTPDCHPHRAETLQLPIGEGGFEPRDIVAALFERGMRRILIEGGAVTISRFLAAGALDRLYILVAPVLFGCGHPSLQLPCIEEVDEALRPETRVFPLPGGDVLFDCSFRARD